MANFNKLPAVLLTASLAAGCSAAAHHESDPTSSTASVPVTALPQATSDSCPVAPAQDLQAVDRLLSAPESPNFLPQAGELKGGDTFQSDQGMRYRLQLAKRLGLHVYQAPPELLNATNLLTNPNVPGPGFSYYFPIAKQFLSKYGVELRVGDSTDEYANGAQAPTAKDLASKNAAVAVADVGEAFDMVPKEYLALGGIKQVVMVTGTERDDVAAYTYPTNHDGKIYIDISETSTAFVSAHVVDHEIYHNIDDSECGDKTMFTDPAYQAINGDKNLYTGKMFDETYASMTGVDSMATDLRFSGQEEQARQSNSFALACSLAQQDKSFEQSFVAYSDYHPRVEEDKAEIGAEIPDVEGYHNMLNPNYGLITQKFRLLFARLYKLSPKVATYFAETSDRYTPSQDPTTSCSQPIPTEGQK